LPAAGSDPAADAPAASVSAKGDFPANSLFGSEVGASAVGDVAIQAAMFAEYCLGQISMWRIEWQSATRANTTLHFNVTQNTSGVVGLALTKDGPFSDALSGIPVQLDASGHGKSAPFFMKGLTAGRTVVDVCSPEVGCARVRGPLDVTIVGLTSAELVPLDSPLDDNPNAGGGKRIFAERQSPAGPVRNTVRIRATATPNAAISFRVFDVDDPSSDAAPVDPNGPTGDDNRGTPRTGTLSTASVQADANGHAETDLTVTMHPGDNFRVAAACNQDYLNGVVAAGTALKDTEGATLPTAGAKVTDMLTVWRSFHVEVDHMGPVTGNQLAGAILKQSTSKNTTVFTLDKNTGQTNRFESGLLRVAGLGDFPVIASSRSTITVSALPPASGSSVGKAYTLVDDDDFNWNDATLRGDEGEVMAAVEKTFSLMQDSDDPAANVYAPAYLRPRYDGGGNLAFNGSVPFALNIPTESRASSSFTPQLELGQNSTTPGIESDGFWVVYLQLAYQGGVTEDVDPDNESIIVGITDLDEATASNDATSEASVPRGGQGSLVFLESARDADRRARPAPHEVGHQFGLKGDGYLYRDRTDFGIMNPTGPLAFIPSHLNVLRWRVKSPGMP
jgi:hypothetical protein